MKYTVVTYGREVCKAGVRGSTGPLSAIMEMVLLGHCPQLNPLVGGFIFTSA